MEIDVNEHRQIRLREVFEPIELISTSGETLIVCMRDGGFEIAVQDIDEKSPDGIRYFSWYKVRNGIIELLSVQDKVSSESEQGEEHDCIR